MTFPKTKKKYGQHFLYDLRVIKRLIEAANISKKDVVLEIGSGTGLLTRQLAENSEYIYSFEIDKYLCELTKENLSNYSNINIINTDFLKYNLNKINEKARLKLVANIPYNITSPIIEKLAKNRKMFSSIYLLTQNELALRMKAKPKDKNYSAFSIYCQYYFDIKKLFNVSPKCFHPWPKVNSTYVLLIPREIPPYKVISEDIFFKVVKSVFWGKRKMIKTSLLKSPYLDKVNEEVIRKVEEKIILNKRPDEVSPEIISEISNVIFQYCY